MSDATTLNATEDLETMTGDDAAWALTCAFLILTMQTGFAMLECGCVSSKNVANIMIKNVVDVSLGGITYWMFGYGLSYGKPSNWFCGMGGWFFSHSDKRSMGSEYSHYFFQLSFATTATTIVSGAVAERMKLHAYMVFSLVNTVVYCFPACWVWNPTGWLFKLGFFDFAGSCVVHFCGGSSALVSVIMLGARLNRFEEPEKYQMSSPVTCLTGMFMLWWAWLGFNCGSTFGVTGNNWKIAAHVSITTTNGAIGGGMAGLFLTMAMNKGKVLVGDIINSCLGGLVGITAVCAVTTAWESIIIGGVGGIIGIVGGFLMNYLRLDDPVGAAPVHFFAALWGTLSVGLFGVDSDASSFLNGRTGVFRGGGFYLLGVQALGALCVGLWSALLTFIFLFVIEKTMGIRVSVEEEILGADWCEHDLRSEGLSQKLEVALRSIDAEHFQSAVGNIVKELDKPKTQMSDGQRVFGTDRLGDHQTNYHLPDFNQSTLTKRPKSAQSTKSRLAANAAGLYTKLFNGSENQVKPEDNDKTPITPITDL